MKKIGVLIVEDSEVVRLLLQHVIGADSRLAVVGAAASAEEALDLLERLSPDVISLDIRLPGMNGFEATRRIMRERPTPIVVCSASVESGDLKITMNALRAGALAVVEKPVGTTRDDYDRLARTLCTQLAIMSEVKVVRQRAFARSTRQRLAGSGTTAIPWRPIRVGIAQSNVSMPSATPRTRSSTSPIPSRCRGRSGAAASSSSIVQRTTSNIWSLLSPSVPPIAIPPTGRAATSWADARRRSSSTPPCTIP